MTDEETHRKLMLVGYYTVGLAFLIGFTFGMLVALVLFIA